MATSGVDDFASVSVSEPGPPVQRQATALLGEEMKRAGWMSPQPARLCLARLLRDLGGGGLSDEPPDISGFAGPALDARGRSTPPRDPGHVRRPASLKQHSL